MQQETAQQIAEARGQAEAKHAAHVEELKALSAEELETSVSNARAELNRAVAERDQQHEEALGLVQADAENLRAELMRLQGEFSARVEQAGQEAYRAYGTQLTEMEARVSATREAHAAAEASFARKQAEMAEQHKEALARVRSDAERAEATIESLQNAVSDQVEQARREEVTAQATKLAEVEARAEAALKTLQQELAARVEQARRQSDAQHRSDLEQLRAQAEVTRAQEQAGSAQRHGKELAQVRAEMEQTVQARRDSEAAHTQLLAELESRAEERLAAAVRDAKSEAESKLAQAEADWTQRHEAELRRVAARAEQTLVGQLEMAKRESDRVRDEAVKAATEATELEAQRRLETAVAQVRAEAERTVGKQLEAAHAKAEERRRREGSGHCRAGSGPSP